MPPRSARSRPRSRGPAWRLGAAAAGGLVGAGWGAAACGAPVGSLIGTPASSTPEGSSPFMAANDCIDTPERAAMAVQAVAGPHRVCAHRRRSLAGLLRRRRLRDAPRRERRGRLRHARDRDRAAQHHVRCLGEPVRRSERARREVVGRGDRPEGLAGLNRMWARPRSPVARARGRPRARRGPVG